MGGEYWCEYVYGFEFWGSCAKLRGSNKYYIGTRGIGCPPIYYCINLNSRKLEDINKEIDNLSESQKNIMSLFDKFAEKYGETPRWQIACVGEVNVDIYEEPNKDYLLKRFYEWTKDIDNLYNEDGSFTVDSDECITCIFREENLDFMVNRALKLKTFEDIYKMIESYYAEE